ncbi:tryptophan 7-halogenase [Sphaerisporangium rubeum]|uniref:FADH2 O2-dependent halogenase n=1 Tax=Sphaerisporangium rubeum TaxID=321317 RepID=A0A7X0I9C8_9ACTN|nr:FAD-dependent oxidoreductase [Sphaerisporangium rubeum]MBB6471014.1 FADH2 O2-dependent halogenase [Sphaerisporangium rubeum]
MKRVNGASARDRYDVAILGSGMAGSMLAAVLARNGVSVLLLDQGTHPRFAVGESTIPYTSAMTRIIADRYQVPEIAALASFTTIQRHISRNSGIKQNFGFVYHREGRLQNPEEINQLKIPTALRTESHLYRQDTDAYLFAVAVKYGADPRPGTRVEEVEIDPDTGVELRTAGGERYRADYVVDAGGYRSPLAERFDLREQPTRARHHSRSLFTHMIGVRPFDGSPAARLHRQPSPWHNGTLHHIFDGGWLWVIPFDNHRGSTNPLCSVGLTLDPRRFPRDEPDPQREFGSFLKRFPDIAWQFEDAVATRPWVSTDRLQYSAKRLVGDRFCLTSHAAGFIDALYSRGLTNTMDVVNALAWRLIEATRDGDWSTERFEYVETLQQGLFDVHDDLVYSSFVGFRDYELWNAVYRTWKIGTVLGTLVLEDAYYKFLRTGDDGLFRALEQTEHPGSPFPISDQFNRFGPLTRDVCIAVENGSMTPSAAAAKVMHHIQDADYIPPVFNLGDPANHFFHATPPKMLSAARWGGTEAPPHVGAVIRGAIGGVVRSRFSRRH